MAFIFILVMVLGVYYLYKHGKYPSNRRRPATLHREETQEELMRTIRHNQKKMDEESAVINSTDPAARIYGKQVDEMLKPGFESGPEWQDSARDLRATIKLNQEKAERELKELE